MTTRSVLISGGGIAGPALAHWLTRRGFAVTVVEWAPTPRPGGQAVDLRGAARTVAERMGLLDDIRAVSLDQRGIAWVRDDGSVAARMPADAFGGEGIVSEIEVLRGDLADVLFQATRTDVEYLFDETVTAVDQDDTGVTVTFERAEPRRFDLVVGADGSHSVVRGLAVASDQDCVTPLGCYTSWFTAPAELDIDGWFLMHNSPGGLVASVRPGRLPGEHKVGLSFRSEPLPYDRVDVAGQKALVAERLAGAVGGAAPDPGDARRSGLRAGLDGPGAPAVLVEPSGWCCSATPRGVRRRSAGSARAWRWSGPTCSRASSRQPTATPGPPSPGTSRCCGPMWPRRSSCRPAVSAGTPRWARSTSGCAARDAVDDPVAARGR